MGTTRVGDPNTCMNFLCWECLLWCLEPLPWRIVPHVLGPPTRVVPPGHILSWNFHSLKLKEFGDFWSQHVSTMLDTCGDIFSYWGSLWCVKQVFCWEDFELKPLQWSYVYLKTSRPPVRAWVAVHCPGATSLELCTFWINYFRLLLASKWRPNSRSYQCIKWQQELWIKKSMHSIQFRSYGDNALNLRNYGDKQ